MVTAGLGGWPCPDGVLGWRRPARRRSRAGMRRLRAVSHRRERARLGLGLRQRIAMGARKVGNRPWETGPGGRAGARAGALLLEAPVTDPCTCRQVEIKDGGLTV